MMCRQKMGKNPLNLYRALLLFLTLSLPRDSYATNAVALEGADLSKSEEAGHDEDPWEGFNRFIFGFNELIDGLLLKPVAELYDLTAPTPVKERLSNFLDNLIEPVTFINEVLQVKPEKAGKTLVRFGMNTTLGLGGMFNIAQDWAELPRRKEDFGQTLAVAGMESGPYLVVPLLGPSNPRDFLGTLVDLVVDPVDYGFRRIHRKGLVWTRKGVDGMSRRAGVLPITNRIDKTSKDKYKTYKILYEQNRRFQIEDGNVVYDDEAPTLDE